MAEINLINLSEIENFKDLSPDFYKSDYMTKSINIRSGRYRRLSQISYITDGEHGSPCWSNNSGIKYITAEFIKENFIANGDFKQITVDQDKRNARARLQKDDILIYSVGAYAGLTCVAEPHLFPANIPRSVAIVRLHNTNEFFPEFISVFLNSQLGKFQSLRFRAGNSQPVLALEKIRQFEVPLIDISFQKEITELYQKSYELRKYSNTYYEKAITLLEKELDLDKITFDNPKSYTASFSEVVNSNRADADFYQVKFKQLEEHISTLKTTALASICSFQKGYEVGTKLYTDDGPTFIRVSNLTINGFTFGNSDKYISNNTYNIFKAHKPNIGDILLTKDGTIGTCYVVDEEVSGIVSSGIMNLTLNDTSIPKEYLALVINSQICQMQADRDCSGALITHWKPEQIRKMKIPILSLESMELLSDLVIRSKAARKESIQLLQQAKNRVEELIEEAGKK